PATPAPARPVSKPLPPPKAQPVNPVDPHAQAFAKGNFPSASECSVCHKQIYDEWRSSNHAYASVSPVFHKFEQKINDLAQGTIGYFCMRCHAAVSTTMGESRDMPLWQRTEVSREGITCVTCHRVGEQYTKVNGERRIEQGDLTKPVLGGFSGDGVAMVVGQKDAFHVKLSDADTGPGQVIHNAAIQFSTIKTSEFCVSCHQVAVHPGIKLEVVWDQYRASPAAASGTTCQECHMGKTPGRAEGYTTAAAAIVGGTPVNPGREHHNHAFYGPGYPIVHPGIFPHNPQAKKFAIQTWLKFDYRAGWGKPDFEKTVAQNPSAYKFPEEWAVPEDRSDARDIVEENLKMLEDKRRLREAVMQNGAHLDGPFFKADPIAGRALAVTYTLHNTNSGHNLPSGSLGAQPEIWLNIALFDPSGRNVWESGYVDSAGDMADLHSRDVRSGKLPADSQLFNLQTKFLTTNVKGTDREMYLPINLDADQLPFIRPAGVPTSVLNHPPFVRMEGRSLPPLSQRDAAYIIPASALQEPGRYRLSIRMRSRAEPMYFMDFIGATPEMDQAMNEWMINLHESTAEFTVAPAAAKKP
ncbi:MAG: multiheme c-type cytochrome, partial [Verrucomicrobiota bacterium]